MERLTANNNSECSINTPFFVLQEIARAERAAGETAAQAKLDVEQQAEADMAKASTHSEVYAKVSSRCTVDTTHRESKNRSDDPIQRG